METLTRKQAINILSSNKWIGNPTFLNSKDGLWHLFFEGLFSDGELIFSYNEVVVGAFKFNRTGFIFKRYDPTDELYMAYLAVLEEIAEDDAKRREQRKIKALKEIEQTYSR